MLRGTAAQVIVWDVAAESAEAVAAEVRVRGAEALAVAVDVTSTDAVAQASRQSPEVDVVVNNAGVVGVARQTDYSASKHAAVGFAESLRAELRKAGSAVRSLVVCPFYIDTGMFAGAQTTVPWLLPVRAFDAVMDMLGDNATMDGFTGRAGAAEPDATDRAADKQTPRTGR